MNVEQKIGAASAAVSGVASITMADVSVFIFGVPVSVVMAAFAGAMISLTFLPGQGLLKAIITVVSGTFAGAYLAPFILRVSDSLFTTKIPEDLDKPVAFLLGLGFQIMVPRFFAWLKSKGGAQ